MKYWEECTLYEQIERWEHVDIVLSNLSPHEKRKHFDMGHWAIKTACGTTACAAGFCGFNPWFRRHGFGLMFEKSKNSFISDDTLVISDPKLRMFAISDYVVTFFGEEGSENIFFNDNDRPVSEVRKEVKAYIKELKEGLKV